MNVQPHLSFSVKGSKARDPLGRAIGMLLRATRYALDVKVNRWQFAIEIEEFRSAGISISELRWLVMSGLAHHAREITDANSESRLFVALKAFAMPANTSFILSDRGIVLLENMSATTSQAIPIKQFSLESLNGISPLSVDSNAKQLLPRWYPKRRELRFNGRIVKYLPASAHNQVAILSAFQEERWIERIDDPLPPARSIDPRRRLRDTIKQLNRNLRNELLAFSADSSGIGIQWEEVFVGED